ncbi:MAG: hypothetical protein JWR50_1784, partial [Mucilaginibacter sp.]|nr:hypothetical protein [Mucilaginibacter sp.]
EVVMPVEKMIAVAMINFFMIVIFCID